MAAKIAQGRGCSEKGGYRVLQAVCGPHELIQLAQHLATTTEGTTRGYHRGAEKAGAYHRRAGVAEGGGSSELWHGGGAAGAG